MIVLLCQAIHQETDVVICDTSGRLHTNWRLMEELADSHKAIQKKVKRVNEVLLVLDGTTGGIFAPSLDNKLVSCWPKVFSLPPIHMLEGQR